MPVARRARASLGEITKGFTLVRLELPLGHREITLVMCESTSSAGREMVYILDQRRRLGRDQEPAGEEQR